MSAKRAYLSKRTRFKIFERDSFTCQYCGCQPPETVLQLDHIHPFSKGGDDSEENLVTACVACNAGKSDRVMGSAPPRPDADVNFLKIQQEMAETKLWLRAKSELETIIDEVCGVILKAWIASANEYYNLPQKPTLVHWIEEYGPDQVDKAILTASYRDKTAPFQGRDGFMKYVSGILRRRKEEAQG